VLLTLGLRRMRQPGGPGLTLLSAGLIVWTTSNAVQTLSTHRWVKDVTLSITFTAVWAVTIGSWWCITALTRRPRMTAARWALVLAPAPITLALVWSRFGGLMFHQVLIPSGQGPVDNIPGPWYPVSVISAYALIGGSLVLFAHAAVKSGERYRRQGIVLVALLSLPLLANVLTVTRLSDFGGYDATPVTVLVTVIGMAVGIRKLGLFDVQIGLLPIAPHVVVRAMRDGVVVVDGLGRVLELNPAAGELLDVAVDAAVGTFAAEVVPGWAGRLDDDATWEERRGNRVLEISATAIDPTDPRPSRVAILRDVTERREAEAALAESARLHHHQSRHDPLTELGNRTLLFERLRDALLDIPDRAEGLALMILDLDGFKELNDGFGHRAGDRALCEIADRLTSVASESTTVARLGGDEFAVLFPGRDTEAAQDVAFRMLDALAAPFSVEGVEVRLAASVGIALAPDDGLDADELVHAADVAMYHAKRTAAGVAVYASAGDSRRPDRIVLRQDLGAAIVDGQLVVHYQPLYTVAGNLAGVEALVRWEHPSRGLLLPGDFLPIAEENDLVCEITNFVLETAARDAARWEAAGTPVGVAVNISGRDLADPRLPERVRAQLERHRVAPRVLTLEITENGLATTREAGARLAALREAGVRISLDDFGTGFAPLSTLRTLPVDEIKIDRSFVRDIDQVERDAALTGALVRLGHDLGLHVVAEGVETPAAARRLTELGCDTLQGFLLGRPLPFDAVPIGQPMSSTPRS
jgi:diguanylate cyclase (GGDEF)-like protein